MNVTMNLPYVGRRAIGANRDINFGGSGGIAATLAPRAIRSRCGGTVAEMATELILILFGVTQWRR